jgi:gas vesicle protein
MTEGEKTSKLHDIKETASDAVEILRQLGTPGVQESMDKVKETATVFKEIMEILKTPEVIKNIENIRLISENINEASTKMQDTMKQLKETGVIDEAKGLFKSAKNTMDSFSSEDGINGQEIHEMSTVIKEMLKSIRGLVDELKINVVSSKKSGIIKNIKETVKDVSDIYKTTVSTHNDEAKRKS